MSSINTDVPTDTIRVLGQNNNVLQVFRCLHVYVGDFVDSYLPLNTTVVS